MIVLWESSQLHWYWRWKFYADCCWWFWPHSSDMGPSKTRSVKWAKHIISNLINKVHSFDKALIHIHVLSYWHTSDMNRKFLLLQELLLLSFNFHLTLLGFRLASGTINHGSICFLHPTTENLCCGIWELRYCALVVRLLWFLHCFSSIAAAAIY